MKWDWWTRWSTNNQNKQTKKSQIFKNNWETWSRYISTNINLSGSQDLQACSVLFVAGQERLKQLLSIAKPPKDNSMQTKQHVQGLTTWGVGDAHTSTSTSYPTLIHIHNTSKVWPHEMWIIQGSKSTLLRGEIWVSSVMPDKRPELLRLSVHNLKR